MERTLKFSKQPSGADHTPGPKFTKHIHNPCAARITSKSGTHVCGAESTRIARDGHRYCEGHYNRLPESLRFTLNP